VPAASWLQTRGCGLLRCNQGTAETAVINKKVCKAASEGVASAAGLTGVNSRDTLLQNTGTSTPPHLRMWHQLPLPTSAAAGRVHAARQAALAARAAAAQGRVQRGRRVSRVGGRALATKMPGSGMWHVDCNQDCCTNLPARSACLGVALLHGVWHARLQERRQAARQRQSAGVVACSPSRHYRLE